MKQPETIPRCNFGVPNPAVAFSSQDVQRRFLLKLRIAFALWIYLALGTMWMLAVFTPDLSSVLLAATLLTASVLFWFVGALMRKHGFGLRLLLMLGGWIALGAAAGFLVNPGAVDELAAISCVVGLTVTGCVVDTACIRTIRTPFLQYSQNGIWILAGCVLTFMFPGTECVLVFSGIFAILVSAALHASIRAIFQAYKPGEYLAASLDVVPILFRS